MIRLMSLLSVLAATGLTPSAQGQERGVYDSIPIATTTVRSLPEVLCFRSWSPSSRFHSRRPRSCYTHWRGREYDGASFQRYRGLRWSRWSQNSALARGRLYQNMAGWKKVRIRLSQPVQRCGKRIFSRVSGRVFYGGAAGSIRFSIPISLC